MKTGLVSISFRNWSVEDIIKACVECKLDSVEWGGDVHVPHGDFGQARKVRKLMDDSGLIAAGYGSYYRVGEAAQDDFNGIVECAKILGSDTIRVWAGGKASLEADEDYVNNVYQDLKRIVGLAKKKNITVSTEYHCGTLTDDIDSALKLFKAVPGVQTFWQPPNGQTFEHRMNSLQSVKKYLTNVHVFYWEDDNSRLPLAEGKSDWIKYFAEIKKIGNSRFACLEFVKDDTFEQLKADAKTLHEILKA